MTELVHDFKDYGARVAFYNLRFNIAYGLARMIIRRNIRLTVHRG